MFTTSSAIIEHNSSGQLILNNLPSESPMITKYFLSVCEYIPLLYMWILSYAEYIHNIFSIGITTNSADAVKKRELTAIKLVENKYALLSEKSFSASDLLKSYFSYSLRSFL